jgi:hypothetical protein
MSTMLSRSFSRWLPRGLWLLFIVVLLGTGAGPVYAAQPDVSGGTNVNAQWDHAVVLRSYQIDPANGDKTVVHADQTLTVTLYCEALQKLAANYTVFVQLVGSGNTTISRKDSPPEGGSESTSAWTPGETVVVKRVLIVPPDVPSGDYTLAVSLYRTTSGNRMPLNLGSGGTFTDRYILPQYITVLTQLTPTPIP